MRVVRCIRIAFETNFNDARHTFREKRREKTTHTSKQDEELEVDLLHPLDELN